MPTLEDALLTVYRQSLLENKKTVSLEDRNFPVRSTAKRKLEQIDVQFDGRELRHLEQNPDTKSLGEDGERRKETMQFLERRKYIAVVADGKVHLYPRKKQPALEPLKCWDILHSPEMQIFVEYY